MIESVSGYSKVLDAIWQSVEDSGAVKTISDQAKWLLSLLHRKIFVWPQLKKTETQPK